MSFDVLNFAADKNIELLNNCLSNTIPGNVYNTFYTTANTLGGCDEFSWGFCCLGNKIACKFVYRVSPGFCWQPVTAMLPKGEACNNLCAYRDQGTWWAYNYQHGATCAILQSMIPSLPYGNVLNAGCATNLCGEYCGFKVCANTLNPCIDVCCQWTVPSGVTRARFQLWGVGGRSNSGCCCGGSIGGTSGAYGSIIIPVVAGCTYTLCVGSGCVIPMVGATSVSSPCPTYVTGYGLCNVCVRGGRDTDLCLYMCYQWASNNQLATTKFSYIFCTPVSGYNICGNGTYYCVAACETCGRTAMVYDWIHSGFYGCYYDVDGTHCYRGNRPIGSFFGTSMEGIPGMLGSMCFSANGTGLWYDPPIFGVSICNCCAFFCANTNNSGSFFAGGIVCNHLDCCCIRFYPGAGALPNFLALGCCCNFAIPASSFSFPCIYICSCRENSNVCAGTGRACGGDIGRGGMICVTMC